MGSHRQRFLHIFSALRTFLRGEARIHSYDCVPSSCSLFTQDVEECAPGGVHDALCQSMILYHVENTQFLNSHHLIVFSVLCFDGLQHLMIQLSRLSQALQEQATLFCIWVQTVLECSHGQILFNSLEYVKYPPAGGRHFTHLVKASGPLAAYW